VKILQDENLPRKLDAAWGLGVTAGVRLEGANGTENST
jgi:hypothetical protein